MPRPDDEKPAHLSSFARFGMAQASIAEAERDVLALFKFTKDRGQLARLHRVLDQLRAATNVMGEISIADA